MAHFNSLGEERERKLPLAASTTCFKICKEIPTEHLQLQVSVSPQNAHSQQLMPHGWPIILSHWDSLVKPSHTQINKMSESQTQSSLQAQGILILEFLSDHCLNVYLFLQCLGIPGMCFMSLYFKRGRSEVCTPGAS